MAKVFVFEMRVDDVGAEEPPGFIDTYKTQMGDAKNSVSPKFVHQFSVELCEPFHCIQGRLSFLPSLLLQFLFLREGGNAKGVGAQYLDKSWNSCRGEKLTATGGNTYTKVLLEPW